MKSTQVTELLNKANIDQDAWESIFPIVYNQLKLLARNVKFNHKKNQNLNTTSLVHEAYIKMKKGNKLNINGSKHFYRIAAQAMRQILVDTARKENSLKRQSNNNSQSTQEYKAELNRNMTSANEVLEIDKVLTQLQVFNSRLADVVIYHFYGGYSFVQIAEIMDLSERTVLRDWKKAKVFIHTQIY